ncbi:MAG: tetratricopeptide repeat-containing sensor histidine kinase [Flavobacteriaceae bacterium]
MKILALLLASALLTGSVHSQEKEIDSLIHVTQTSTDSSAVALAHGRLAWLLMYHDLEAAFAHNDSSYALYQNLKDQKNKAIANYKYGVLYRVRGNYKLALSHMNLYRDYVASEKDSFGLANSYFQIGVIHSKKGDYEEALQYYFNTFDIYETRKDTTGMGFTLNSIGIVYKNLKKYKEAIEIYKEVIGIHTRTNDSNRLADAYHNLGAIYQGQGKFDKALTNYFKSNEINAGTNNQWGKALNYADIGGVFMEKKEFSKAIEYFNKAFAIQKANSYTDDIGLTLANLGEASLRLGNYNRSERYLKEGLGLTGVSKRIKRELHFNMFELYEQQAQYGKALVHHKEFFSINDSLINQSSLENINALQVQFETEKKDKELAQQKLQLRTRENMLLKAQNQKKFAITAVMVLLVLSLLGWFYLRQRQRLKTGEIEKLKAEQEVVKLEALIQGEEKERVRLAQDLHDGINGDLAVIKYKITSLDTKKLGAKDKTAFDQAVSMLDNAVDQVRRISHNLAPPALKNFDLIEAISHYCSKLASTNPTLEIDFQFYGNKLKLDKETETTLYRMVQELVNNVVKHAKATEALVQINHREQALHITVEDNGLGFDPNSVASGIGLQNVRSRTSYLMGDLEIESGKNGSSIHINIDLNRIKSK